MKKVWKSALMALMVLAIAIPLAACGGTESEKPKATLTSATLDFEPDKTEYCEGEKFDPTGMVITGTYSDGTKKQVPIEEISWDKTGGLTKEDTLVKVTCGDKTFDITISVVDAVILLNFTATGDTCRLYSNGKVVAGNGGALDAYDTYGDAVVSYLLGIGTWKWDGTNLTMKINDQDMDISKNPAGAYIFTLTKGEWVINFELAESEYSKVFKPGVPMPA